MSAPNAYVKKQLTAIAAARAMMTAKLKPPQTPADILGIALKPGARVLDRLSGQEGTVSGATIEHTILPTP